MIQANELRIGNWIYWDIPEKKGVFHKVLAVKSNIPNTLPISLGESYDDFSGIPLTHQILEKCGFVVTRTTAHPNNIWTLKHEEGVFELEEIKLFFLCSSQYEVQVKYLHQLQNLYFCLSGEELNFKP